ncbi:MAG: Hpt domain-containing protein [Sulfurimonas sp.]|nr:Hpt domain-containing protein [Sulfurimonas sp.]
MLIYNYKKEFLGIDENDLKVLGLLTLADLRAEAADFADLFVKTPGFIHNFKHVHWIDYIICSTGGDASKAIINIKDKNYTTFIDIQTIYLVDNPSEKAFVVNLSNIRPLSNTQSEKISADILEKPAPLTSTESTELFTTPGSIVHEDIAKVSYDPYEAQDETLNPNIVEDIYDNETFDVDVDLDKLVDTNMGSDIQEVKIESSNEPGLDEPNEFSEKVTDEEDEIDAAFADYVFDPHVASDELGLPIDLVEEFIQDFIAQANSFKDELYKSVEDGDLDNLKVQSHKLKGVAANLRVEDALDTLTTINFSSDIDEIKHHLNILYKTIAKLSNKAQGPTTNHNDTKKEDEDEDEDEFVLSLKYDEPEVTLETSNESETSYDKQQIANAIGIDIDSFNELFEDYIGESKKLTNSIITLIKNDDLNECKNIAANLKGMSENMRIHNFDDELNAIINSTDTNELHAVIDNIVSKLNQISSQENK